MDVNKLCLFCLREKPVKTGPCPFCRKSLDDYTPNPHHLPPQTIIKGRYMLGVVLGEGGFGITYAAYDLVEDRRVAIKELFLIRQMSRKGTNVVLTNPANDEEKNYCNACKTNFLREANILHYLKNREGIVSLLDEFEENGTAYIVMEYLDGMDLKDYIRDRGGHLSFQEAFTLLTPVMLSMIEVHDEKIIHRDINPRNIRYLGDGKLKIMDFGTAKFFSADHTLMITYTKGYSPEEQYSPNYKVGPWMDVYSMAAIFYFCMTGEKPVESINRTEKSDQEMFSRLDADEDVQAVLKKGMAPLAEKRYKDMKGFYMDLQKVAKAASLSSEEEPRENRALFTEEYKELLWSVHKRKKMSPELLFLLLGIMNAFILSLFWAYLGGK